MFEDRWTEYSRREADEQRRRRKTDPTGAWRIPKAPGDELGLSPAEIIEVLVVAILVMVLFSCALVLAKGNLT